MYQIEKLNPRHYKILEYCLRGWTNKQIADHLGMTQQAVSIVVNSPSFQHELATRRSKLDNMVDESIVASSNEVTEAIRSYTLAAVHRLGLIASNANSRDADAVRASAEILDRGGFPKVHQVESRNLSVVIRPEDAVRIEETLAMDK